MHHPDLLHCVALLHLAQNLLEEGDQFDHHLCGVAGNQYFWIELRTDCLGTHWVEALPFVEVNQGLFQGKCERRLTLG